MDSPTIATRERVRGLVPPTTPKIPVAAMTTELRKTGISVIGDIPFGAHFCCFYDTREDLLDILIPYFKIGLENNEFCLWVISNSELLTVQEAMSALRNAVPDIDRHLTEGNLEIVGHDEWFVPDGNFNLYQVANRFKEKAREALARGHVGLRVNGSPAWLQPNNARELRHFEEVVDQLFSHLPILASCTYPLPTMAGDQVFDTVQTHQFAIARRQGRWEIIETPELRRARSEIERLTLAEEQLKKEKEILEKIFDNIPVMIAFVSENSGIKLVNPEWERTIGWTVTELEEQNVDIYAEAYPDPHYRQIVLDFVKAATGEWLDLKIKVRDGRVIDAACAIVLLSDGTRLVIAQDVTERKQAEDAVRQSEDSLRLAIDTIPIMAWSVQAGGNVDYVNQRWFDYTGLTRDQYFQDPNSIVHPEDRARAVEKWLTVMAAGEPYEAEMRLQRADGEYRWFLIRIAPLRDKQGNVIKWYGVATDIEKLMRAEERIKATSERLRALSARLQSAKEEEDIRIAREIHDEMGSSLASLRWELDRFDESISEAEDWSQRKALRARIADMMKLADMAIGTMRRIAAELRPSILDDLGLAEAIEWETEQFQSRTGIACFCDCSMETFDLEPDQSTAIFRIFQEALTNVLRHARATTVEVVMREEEGNFILTITDNGRGITENEKSGTLSLGILGMRERAHLIGAVFEISGVEGKGTSITLRVPVSGKASGKEA
jgi:PAS domain S-box-containing protein